MRDPNFPWWGGETAGTARGRSAPTLLLTRRSAQRGSAVSLGSRESCRDLSRSPFFELFSLSTRKERSTDPARCATMPGEGLGRMPGAQGGEKKSPWALARKLWVQQLGSTLRAKSSHWKGIFPAKRPGSPWPVAPWHFPVSAGTRAPCVCWWDLEDFFSTAT